MHSSAYIINPSHRTAVFTVALTLSGRVIFMKASLVDGPPTFTSNKEIFLHYFLVITKLMPLMDNRV